MRYFEDLRVGETLGTGGLVVDRDEAAAFARRFDPMHIPPSGVGYVHRGPRISPWQAGALSWKLLVDLAASRPVEGVAFSRPSNVEWGMEVSVGDELRVEVTIDELLQPSPADPDRGWARVKVAMITTGAAGFGAWGDDDQERVDDVALTYSASLEAQRREKVSPFYGIG